MKDSVVVGGWLLWEIDDKHSVVAHPAWMMNTLFDIDCLAQYELSV